MYEARGGAGGLKVFVFFAHVHRIPESRLSCLPPSPPLPLRNGLTSISAGGQGD